MTNPYAPVTVAVQPVAPSDQDLLARVREGDEAAFESLVERYHRPMLAVARAYVRGTAVAEEVVQDAWVGVLRGLDRFEERSSLKTWILRIVANTAMTRGVREARSVPFSALDPATTGRPWIRTGSRGRTGRSRGLARRARSVGLDGPARGGPRRSRDSSSW